LAATRAHIARRDHDRELKIEQTVLGLPIKTSNSNAIENPLVAATNKAASGMMPSARVRLAVDGGSAASSKWAGLTDGVETR
jgi:hypothetical protein